MSQLTTKRTIGGGLAVYLENRRVGTIAAMKGGYAYIPAGHPRSQHGEVFPTPNQVMETLMWVPGDDPQPRSDP
jgi:hypothetical protein